MDGSTAPRMTAPHVDEPGPRRSSSRADRRRRVVDAFIDLVLEGGGPPDPSEVADRAGVSRATFFRYFSTLDELRGEAAGRTLERFWDLVVVPDPGTGNLDVRIERFVDSRVAFHEALHPLSLLLRASAARDAESAELLDAGRKVLADQAAQQFAAELGVLTPARRDDLLFAIAVMTSVESWQQFRHTHGRSPMQTRRAWRAALGAMLSRR